MPAFALVVRDEALSPRQNNNNGFNGNAKNNPSNGFNYHTKNHSSNSNGSNGSTKSNPNNRNGFNGNAKSNPNNSNRFHSNPRINPSNSNSFNGNAKNNPGTGFNGNPKNNPRNNNNFVVDPNRGGHRQPANRDAGNRDGRHAAVRDTDLDCRSNSGRRISNGSTHHNASRNCLEESSKVLRPRESPWTRVFPHPSDPRRNMGEGGHGGEGRFQDLRGCDWSEGHQRREGWRSGEWYGLSDGDEPMDTSDQVRQLENGQPDGGFPSNFPHLPPAPQQHLCDHHAGLHQNGHFVLRRQLECLPSIPLDMGAGDASPGGGKKRPIPPPPLSSASPKYGRMGYHPRTHPHPHPHPHSCHNSHAVGITDYHHRTPPGVGGQAGIVCRAGNICVNSGDSSPRGVTGMTEYHRAYGNNVSAFDVNGPCACQGRALVGNGATTISTSCTGAPVVCSGGSVLDRQRSWQQWRKSNSRNEHHPLWDLHSEDEDCRTQSDAATRSLAHLTEATPATAKTAAPPADLPCTASTVGTTVGGTAPAANSSSSSSTPHKSIPSSSTPTTPSTTPGDTSSLTPPSSSTSNAVAASASTGASPSGTTAPSAAKDGVAEDEAGTASTLADSSSGGSSGSTSSGSSGSSAKRPQGQPMAFTIDLGDEAGGATSDTNKKLDISDSIRKWAPRHRRNLSLTKVDENKKVEEKVGKPPMGRPRSGTVGTAGLPGAAGTRRGGYHSEGYFSSDQDDEAPRNRELKSPRSPRTPELRSPLSQTRGQVQRSSSQDSSKGVNLRKQGGKPEGRACCKDGKKPTVAQVTGKVKTEKVCKEEHNAPEEDADNVSETGTYTIEKDSSSPEVEQARQDIDRVFGVSGTESDADVALLARGTITATSVAAAIPSSTTVTSTAGVIHSSDETWNGTTESEKFKGQPSLSRSSPNWIQQWAAQVAEQTKSSTDKTAMAALGSPRGNKPPLASPTLRGLSTSQESSESRPRRILPTPPVHSAPYTLPSPSHSSPFTLPSPRGQEPSDQESPTKAGRTRGDIYDNLGKKSDSSLDTESYLRDTENLMTSLQARMDLAKTSPAGYRGSSFESHDSGGDSDLDTSTSYPISGTDERLSKVLKAKLKLGSSGDEGTKVSPVVASPRKLDPLALDTRLKMTSHFKRERSIMSDGGYEMYSSRREDHGLQSDSSSETSEPIKDARKASDNNPPLKFNRAFSLRRARLGCDDSSPSPQTPTAPDKKKKSVRPNSAGTIGSSSRRTPTGVARNEAKNTSQSNKGSAVENFLRADGGRFSLRVPKSGSTTTVSKSPSRAATKKEQSVAGRRGAPRSNSTLSAKEIDFQNWKRRKNYDPMKAAAEGRKKQGDKKPEKSGSTPPNVNVTTSDARSPSPPGSLLRSASFHGTVGLGMSATKWNRRPNHLNTSEDEAPLSLEEDHLAAPHASPLRRSPTSPHQMASPISASPAHHALNARARRSSYAHSEDGEGHHGTISRKASLDESGSEGKVSPMGTSRGPSSTSGRSKAKMEALDNLVISTIHSLSVKVRTTSENLLQKLKSQYDEEGDRAALLEAVLSHLSEGDQSLSASQSRSTSRELAGILQNLKKIGNALEVIDRVLILEDDDDLDDDDLEGTGAGDWSDRDY